MSKSVDPGRTTNRPSCCNSSSLAFSHASRRRAMSPSAPRIANLRGVSTSVIYRNRVNPREIEPIPSIMMMKSEESPDSNSACFATDRRTDSSSAFLIVYSPTLLLLHEMIVNTLTQPRLTSLEKLLAHCYSPISSAQMSGYLDMKMSINSLHSLSSDTRTSTPLERSHSNSPGKVAFSPTTTVGIPN